MMVFCLGSSFSSSSAVRRHLRYFILFLACFPLQLKAQSEAGLILNAILQGLQTAESIRRSMENSPSFPNSPRPFSGDPIWDYQESSLVPMEVLRQGPYRNLSGQIVLSARQTPDGKIELIFYRNDGSVFRREFVRYDRREGRRVDLDEKGSKTAEGPIRQGLPEGDWRFYSPEGRVTAETSMRAGQMTGPQTLFAENGRPRSANHLVDGKRQGLSTLFHPDGSVSDNLNYRDDQLEGPAQGWWPDGTPRYTATWKAGKLEGPSIEFFSSGKKRSESFYKSGKKEGPARTWNEKGELVLEEEWSDDQLEGWNREFYADGKVKIETSYRRGKKHGRWQSFGADGALATSGEFKEGRLEGPLRIHYPNGRTFAECQYEADRLAGGRLFYPDGKALGQFGPALGRSGKVSFLLLQYPDGKPFSSASLNGTSNSVSWLGWNPDGTSLGHLEWGLDSPQSDSSATGVWQSQQESLEAKIGLALPPEFNLLPQSFGVESKK